MRIFEYSYSVGDYSGGVMLIAAKDEKTAEKEIRKNYSGGWKLATERTDIKYTGISEEADILVEFTYVE